jgi:hypothetical protein
VAESHSRKGIESKKQQEESVVSRRGDMLIRMHDGQKAMAVYPGLGSRIDVGAAIPDAATS